MAAAKPRTQLDVLAYRCTPALLDGADVYLREFPQGVRSMWKILERNYLDRTKHTDQAQAPYSVITNALRCLTGGHAYFDPKKLFLVTGAPITDDLLQDTFTLFCGLTAGEHIDDIDLTSPAALAERIAETPQETRHLADYLTRTNAGQPDAPPWVYKSATWLLSRRLTETPWTVDGQDITLHPDSDGGFIAWDHPWPNKSRTAFAFARGRMVMKTHPNIKDPLILLSASATRLKKNMAFARTVLAAQAEPGRPIVEVEMAGRGRIRSISRMSLEVLARLGMDQSILHAIQQRVDDERAELEAATAQKRKPRPLDTEPGNLRPIQSKNYKFSVGRGVGMHFLRELDRKFREVFGDTAQQPGIYVDLNAFKRRKIKEEGLLPKPADVERSLTSMGMNHLRLVCLWYRDENRVRMIRGLAHAYRLPLDTLDPVEGVPIALYGSTISTVFHQVPQFLEHGPASGSAADIAHIAALKPEPGVLVGVWAETAYASLDDEIDEDAEATPTSTAAQELPEDQDAKHRGRRTLAERDIVSQFIKESTSDSATDHPAQLAQLDLYRSLGIIDDRIDDVMIDTIAPGLTASDVVHCGIHVRRQSKRKGERSPRICITATALKPPTAPGRSWTLLGWSYTDRKWKPYHQAQAQFHAQDYPTGKLTEELVDTDQGGKAVAKLIDDALGKLVAEIQYMPYTVTVDGFATRRLWDGLHNNKQGITGKAGTTWLPGHTLPLKERPIAVIRVNKNAAELPIPIRTNKIAPDGEITKGNNTSNALCRVDVDFADPVWLLTTVPLQYDGAGTGRLGATKTRWTADFGSNVKGELRKNEAKANWYAMNTTEIYVIPSTPDIDTSALAYMTARLCHQSLGWTRRTRYPVHLHAANQMDLDHPQFRRSALGGDTEAETLGEAPVTDDLTED